MFRVNLNFVVFIVLIFVLSSCQTKNKKIGVQPYQFKNAIIIDSISNILERTYGIEVVVLPSKKLPSNSFVNIKTPRYRADSLLIDLKENIPDSINYVIGVTAKDISTTVRDVNDKIKEPQSKYKDWGIFGLGYRPGVSCVISTYRLKHSNREKYLSRIQKVAIHEIGHNMGLKHCETDKCVMQDAVESIKTVDNEGFELCKKCLNKL